MRKKENQKSAVLEHTAQVKKTPAAAKVQEPFATSAAKETSTAKGQEPPATPSAKDLATLAAPSPNGQMSEADIQLRAYRKWEAAGKPTGDEMRFWLQAEQELKEGK